MEKQVKIARIALMAVALGCYCVYAWLSGTGQNATASLFTRAGVGFLVTSVATHWVRSPRQWQGAVTAFFSVVSFQFAAYEYGYAAAHNSSRSTAYSLTFFGVVLAVLCVRRLMPSGATS